jgi:hypothetical protein
VGGISSVSCEKCSDYFVAFSHFWLATPQLVLQALWQEVWHSPHPPFLALSQRSLVSSVLILFISMSPYINEFIHFVNRRILSQKFNKRKTEKGNRSHAAIPLKQRNKQGLFSEQKC